MQNEITKIVAEIRLIVGFLGEESQFNWWSSNFLGVSSGAFLMHTFPRTGLLSQYHGVNESALLVHDEYVGIGKNYHVFRLPVSIERNTASAIQRLSTEDKAISSLGSKETALQRLSELANKVEASDGPTLIGTFTDESLEHLLRESAGLYLSAFQQGIKCFPFMRGENGDF